MWVLVLDRDGIVDQLIWCELLGGSGGGCGGGGLKWSSGR